MAKNFSFSEFLNQTASLQRVTATLQANGGWVDTPVEVDSFACCVQPVGGDKIEQWGLEGLQVSHAVYTDELVNVLTGDILVIGAKSYEVVSSRAPNQWLGSYTALLVKERVN